MDERPAKRSAIRPSPLFVKRPPIDLAWPRRSRCEDGKGYYFAPNIRVAFVGGKQERLYAWVWEQRQPCLVCVGRFKARRWIKFLCDIQVDFEPRKGWGVVRQTIAKGEEVSICPSCWESCPYHGRSRWQMSKAGS